MGESIELGDLIRNRVAIDGAKGTARIPFQLSTTPTADWITAFTNAKRQYTFRAEIEGPVAWVTMELPDDHVAIAGRLGLAIRDANQAMGTIATKQEHAEVLWAEKLNYLESELEKRRK